MLAIQPTLTPAQIASKLKASARPFPTTGGSTASIPTCTSSSTSQDECYCPNPIPNLVGALCGAGMLDTHAALLAVNGVQASISLTTTTPTAAQAVALTSDSVVGAGQSIVSYAWTILNAGTTGATITGANNGASVVVTPTAGGSFVIQLKTTDSTGFASVANLSVSVAGPVTQPTSTPSGASSGGGGALGAGWLLLLLAAVLSLALTSARERRARAALSAAARDAGKR
jgi:serine protease